MTLNAIFEGESRLLGVIGANVSLGGARAFASSINKLMPCLSDMLLLTQIAVGLATLVYMLLKIRKILRQKKSDA